MATKKSAPKPETTAVSYREWAKAWASKMGMTPKEWDDKRTSMGLPSMKTLWEDYAERAAGRLDVKSPMPNPPKEKAPTTPEQRKPKPSLTEAVKNTKPGYRERHGLAPVKSTTAEQVRKASRK